MTGENGTGLFIKVPLSCIKFADPLEQKKFEKRLAGDEGKAQLVQEIEELISL